MKIHPLGNRVLIKRDELEEYEKHGIIIPATAQEKPMEATVITLGTGGRTAAGDRIPFEIDVGDHVLIGKYSGAEIKIDDEDYLVIFADDILAIVP